MNNIKTYSIESTVEEMINLVKDKNREISNLKREYSKLENKYFDLANKYEDLEITNIIEERKDCTETHSLDEVKKMIDERLNGDI